jgi:GT2 family glycosyltransferase
MQVSAYIPSYNSRATIVEAVNSIQAQTRAVDELFVVDNGSTDNSAELVESMGVRVIRLAGSGGRGRSRARAMEEARYPLVLCCDSAISLPPDFLAKAERWFEDEAVGAVCGRISQEMARTAADRWRGRHLFRTHRRMELEEHADFTTGGAMVRASAVLDAGGYDAGLEHGEDADLGRRLTERGMKVVFDPALIYYQLGSNSMGKVLERYWRWNRARGRLDFLTYLRQIKYSVTVMAREDMETADIGAALISLVSPHYQFWKDRGE